jgi:glycosyltransferase involved in cell wall biosynthesis
VPSHSAQRIAVLGAFPFPLPQGSQVFVRDQLRALRAAGVETTLVCYGSGVGDAPNDLHVVRVPRILSPRALRAGPSLGKPLADAALARVFARAHRSHRFQAVLAHNAEAALAALAARRSTGVPVVYVAHTLLGRELDAYGPRALGFLSRRVGALLDRGIAAAVDGIAALSSQAVQDLARYTRAPIERIPPGHEPAPAPDAREQAELCARFGVEPSGFALYTGNLDRYQDLDELARAARLVPEVPIVVATHAARGRVAHSLRLLRVSPEQARALTFACAVALLPRRRAGGFPIKLLNYMEAARPIIARQGVAEGLVHARSAWLLEPDAPVENLASAIRVLASDPKRAAALVRGARATLETQHAWPELVKRTLLLIDAARAAQLGA